jgi:uncharacterized delta-60 repeat protein
MRAGLRAVGCRAIIAIALLIALGGLVAAPSAFAGKVENGSDVALQADGKIVVAGDSNSRGTQDFALARYNPDGSLDKSFAGDGRLTTNFGRAEIADAVAIQANGKIVAAGFASSAKGLTFALTRYNAGGSLDSSFAGDGKQTTRLGGDAIISGLAIQANGKIVATGTTGVNTADFAIARYNTDGSLDQSFSGDGTQTTAFSGAFAFAYGIAIATGGKLVAVGYASDPQKDYFAVARYRPDGSLDPSFSGDGKQTTDFGAAQQAAYGVAIQADGRIVAAGESSNDGFALARYNAVGSLDPSFAGDGTQTTSLGPCVPFIGCYASAANDVAIGPAGAIVAAGYAGIPRHAFALARYGADGSLDASFGDGGTQITPFRDSADGNAVALQADAKIIVAGTVGDQGSSNFALARYNADGSLDPSFSGDGLQTTDFGGSNDTDGDGVGDAADGCPTKAGPAANHGCPKKSGGTAPACHKARAKLDRAKKALKKARQTHHPAKVKEAKKRVKKAKHAVRAAC